VFFEKLTREVFANPEDIPLGNMNLLGTFFKFIMKYDPITFQAFFLYYNLPYYLAAHLDNTTISDLMVQTLSPTSAYIDCNEESLNRYAAYARLSNFLFDLSEVMVNNSELPEKKKSLNYRPLFLGEISKAISTGSTGISSDLRELPEEDMYTLVEERRGIKNADIDLLLKHFNDLSKKKSVLFKMRSAIDKISSTKRLTFEIEKARYPEIYEKLKNSKDAIEFVDYEKIRHREVFKVKGANESLIPGKKGSKNTNEIDTKAGEKVDKNAFDYDANRSFDDFDMGGLTRSVNLSELVTPTKTKVHSRHQTDEFEIKTLVNNPPSKRQSVILNDMKHKEVIPEKPKQAETSRSVNNKKEDPKNAKNQGKNKEKEFVDPDPPIKQKTTFVLPRSFLLTAFADKETEYTDIKNVHPTEQKSIKKTEIDERLAKMKFPKDYLENERANKSIALYFNRIVMNIKLAEIAKCSKIREKSTFLDPNNLIVTMLESNDFEVFDNIVKVNCFY